MRINRGLKEDVRRLQCAVTRAKWNSAKTMLRVWVRVNEVQGRGKDCRLGNKATAHKLRSRMALKFISVRDCFRLYSFVPLTYFFVAIDISSVSSRHEGVWWSGNAAPYFTCALCISQ